MMEVNALSQSPSAPNSRNSGQESSAAQRNEALAQNRRELTEDHIARAAVSQARTADRLAEVREAVARVLGANTRLSISRAENSLVFVYRAIDIHTGEIVNEWPQDTFVELVRGVREDVRTDIEAGLVLDSLA